MSAFIGISFPFRKGQTSFPEKVEDADLIRQSIIQILLTGRGERLMRPDFGSGVTGLVFDNNNPTLAASIEAEVFSALGKFEPRVVVRSVTTSSPKENQVIVTVNYVVLATRQQDSVGLSLSAPQ